MVCLKAGLMPCGYSNLAVTVSCAPRIDNNLSKKKHYNKISPTHELVVMSSLSLSHLPLPT